VGLAGTDRHGQPRRGPRVALCADRFRPAGLRKVWVARLAGETPACSPKSCAAAEWLRSEPPGGRPRSRTRSWVSTTRSSRSSLRAKCHQAKCTAGNPGMGAPVKAGPHLGDWDRGPLRSLQGGSCPQPEPATSAGGKRSPQAAPTAVSP
jgi:hypothetical protein